jgi:hypothetical protein
MVREEDGNPALFGGPNQQHGNGSSKGMDVNGVRTLLVEDPRECGSRLGIPFPVELAKHILIVIIKPYEVPANQQAIVLIGLICGG